jgi:hypothetical protein
VGFFVPALVIGANNDRVPKRIDSMMTPSPGSASPRTNGVTEVADAASEDDGSVVTNLGTGSAAAAEPLAMAMTMTGTTHTKRRAAMARLLEMRRSALRI